MAFSIGGHFFAAGGAVSGVGTDDKVLFVYYNKKQMHLLRSLKASV